MLYYHLVSCLFFDARVTPSYLPQRNLCPLEPRLRRMAREKDTAFTLILVQAVVMLDYGCVGAMRTVLPYYAKSLGAAATGVGALETIYGRHESRRPRERNGAPLQQHGLGLRLRPRAGRYPARRQQHGRTSRDAVRSPLCAALTPTLPLTPPLS